MPFRPLLLAAALLVSVALGPGLGLGPTAIAPAQAQTSVQSLQIAPGDAEAQVRGVMYHRLMAEVLRTGIREQVARGGSAVGEVNPYPSTTAGKALAVCVNWQKSTLDRVVWGGFAYRYGATVTPADRDSLTARTLADCRSAYAGRDCGCELLDVDDRNVLQVPAPFLAEYGRF